VISTLFTL